VSLCLTNYSAMKTYWGSGSTPSALGGDEWSATRPGRFTPGEKSPGYPLDRRLGGLQSCSGLGSLDKKSLPVPGIESLLSSL
jgi:hypothetical protein